MRYSVLKYDIVDDEIEAVIIYYETISYGLGERFESEIENALTNLEHNAHHYFNLEDGLHRRIPIVGFPYALIYSIAGSEVTVKMLFPQLQDPARLRARLLR